MASPLGLTLNGKSVTDKTKYFRISNNVESLFDPKNQFIPFPSGKDGNFSLKTTQHSDDTYNLSVSEIINYTEKYTSMKLTFADFAYLKKLGVIPNNRLIIARRFQNPVGNDLTASKAQPMATLISWMEKDEMVDINFGEEWEEADGSFKEVLNDIGKEFVTEKSDFKLGDRASGGFTVAPLRGFTEGLVYKVYEKLGITDKGNTVIPPLGNPNLIRQAKQRKVLEKDKAGTGLKGKFKIKMKVEYEQKYIQGVDPSFVYLDIIQNALTFGTSDSYFQFNSSLANNTSKFIQDLMKGDTPALMSALSQFVVALIQAIGEVGSQILKSLSNSTESGLVSGAKTVGSAVKNLFVGGESEATQQAKKDFLSSFNDLIKNTLGNIIKKYKLKLLGVLNSLTGTPSGPWHVTVGNPRRPILSSGDMIIDSVDLKLGPILSFNDLPSSITLDFTLESARNLGAQEIFERLNTGKGRTYARKLKSLPETISVGELKIEQQAGTSSLGVKDNTGNAQIPDPFIQTGTPVQLTK